MTASTNKSSRFAKGSGVYTCNCCGRQTRSTGRGDNENLKLCAECYELAGYDNQVSDYGVDSLTPNQLAEIRQLINTITSKGATVDPVFLALLPPIPVETKAEAADPKADDQVEYPLYLVTITGPEDFEPVLLPVDATKSSQARRLAKQALKAEGLNIEGLTFNARRY